MPQATINKAMKTFIFYNFLTLIKRFKTMQEAKYTDYYRMICGYIYGNFAKNSINDDLVEIYAFGYKNRYHFCVTSNFSPELTNIEFEI